jgi:hypothetical protein
MVTPARAQVGTAAVTAAGQVTWRGAVYATSTTGYGTGDLVRVLHQDGALTVLGRAASPAGGGAYLPLAGGTLTGPLEFTTPGALRAKVSTGATNLDIGLTEANGAQALFPGIRLVRAAESRVEIIDKLTLGAGMSSGQYLGASTFAVDVAGNLTTDGDVVSAGIMAAARIALPAIASPGGRRWMVSVTESGAPWVLYRYGDDGTYAGTALSLNRATGAATFETLRTGKAASNEGAAVLNRGENDARYVSKTALKAAAAAAASFADFQTRIAAL